MEFSVNHPIIFVIVSIVILVVLAQSIFFLVRAVKRSKEINMDQNVIKKTIISAVIFTIAPALAIVVGVIALSKSLGIAIPWLRLSVVGSLSYENIAAGVTLDALGLSMSETITSASAFVTVVFIMTFGICIGLLLIPLLTKKIQGGINKIEAKDKKWGEILNNAMFLGMISAFLGYVFGDVSGLWLEGTTAGLVPVCVMVCSAIIMAILGLLATKCKVRWLYDYALPISLIGGMALAIPFTAWLG